jgi:hypothetical protein
LKISSSPSEIDLQPLESAFPESRGSTPLFNNHVYAGYLLGYETPTLQLLQSLGLAIAQGTLTFPQFSTPYLANTPQPHVATMARITMRYENFEGSSRKDPEMFMQEFESKAKSNNQGTDDVKAVIFGGLMIKTAQTWYRNPVKGAFLKKYQEEEASSRAFTKIKHLKMHKHRVVRKYADTLLELVNKYEPSTSADTIRDWFITGLPSAIN